MFKLFQTLSYKQFILLIVPGVCAVAFLYAQIIIHYYHDPRQALWVKNSVQKKWAYASAIKEKKWVFMGGSATLFGISTQDIETQLGVASINMGLQGSLRADYIIYLTKKILKPGDSVFVAMEYQLLLYDGGMEHNLGRSAYLFSGEQDYFRSLGWLDQAREVFSVLPADIYRAVQRNKNFAYREVDIGMGYTSSTINQHGDETYHPGPALLKKKIKQGSIKPFAVPEGGFKETLALREIRAFEQWCSAHRIRFYVSFPNVVKFKEFSSRPYRDYFLALQEYYKRSGFNTIGRAQDFFFPVDYFYDTAYHLNAKGMSIRTEQLIGYLKENLISH